MEEVWKDINLASLNDHSSRESLSSLNLNHHNLQDFLARPFSKQPQTNKVSSTNGETTFSVSPITPPATVLSLNPSRSGFNFIDNSYPPRPNSRLQMQSKPISNLSYLQMQSNPISNLSYSDKKRILEPDSYCGDRRHKRMIKNRESAARSRARRQAYTNELELEVAHLMEENARLKRQHEQLSAGDSAQVSTKRTLQRTLTAPF